MSRSRWAAFGAAVAVVLGSGGAFFVANAANSAASSFVSVAPCRLFDTRPAPATVGTRNTPLAAGVAFDAAVTGTHGRCTIPTTATAVSFNLSVPNPAISGSLTLWRADAARPATPVLSILANGGTRSNGGVVQLSGIGHVKLVSSAGPVNAQLDITGYYLPAALGPQGVAGPQGAPGGNWTQAGKCSATHRWDTAACQSTNFPLGGPTGARNLLVLSGTLLVTNASGQVSVVNTTSGVVSTIGAANANDPRGLATDGTRVYIVNNATSSVTSATISPLAVTAFPLPVFAAAPEAIAFTGQYLYTTNSTTNNVMKVDVTASPLVPVEITLPANAGPKGIVFDGKYIWTANAGADSVTRIDAAGVKSSFSLPVGSHPSGITFDGRHVWVTDEGTDSVSRIDRELGTVNTVSLPVGADGPRAVFSDGINLWTANFLSDNVSRIPLDGGTAENVALPAGATGPNDITSDGTFVWTANFSSNNVTRLVP